MKLMFLILLMLCACTKEKKMISLEEGRKLYENSEELFWPEPKEYRLFSLESESFNTAEFAVIPDKYIKTLSTMKKFNPKEKTPESSFMKKTIYKCFEQGFDDKGDLINLPTKQTAYYKKYNDKDSHPKFDPSKYPLDTNQKAFDDE